MSIARPADLVVIAAAALLVGASWATLWHGGGPAEYLQVSIPGAPPEQHVLAKDAVLEVGGRLGTSRLEIRDGRARFVDSPCANRLCVHAGWLSRSGQVAACLPNAVVIEIGGSDREFDAISY